MSRGPGRLGAAVGLAVATAAAGAAVGAVAQRNAARKILRRPDAEADEPLDADFGDITRVRTDDGVHLAVEVIEPTTTSTNLTMVFTHGFALGRHTWHYQSRDLSDLGRIVVWDQRGHGSSERGDDESYTVERFARDLQTVIEAAAPDGPIVLIGHSMGGMTVMQWLSLFPDTYADRVVGVVLMATASTAGESELAIAGPLGKFASRVAPSLVSTLRGRTALVERTLEFADDLVVIVTERYGFGSSAAPSLVEHTKRMHAEVPLDVLAGCLPAFVDLDLTANLPELQRVETLVMVGEGDVMTPVSLSQDLVRRVPGADLVVLADTGHMLMLERYAEVNHRLREFVHRVATHARAA